MVTRIRWPGTTTSRTSLIQVLKCPFHCGSHSGRKGGPDTVPTSGGHWSPGTRAMTVTRAVTRTAAARRPGPPQAAATTSASVTAAITERDRDCQSPSDPDCPSKPLPWGLGARAGELPLSRPGRAATGFGFFVARACVYQIAATFRCYHHQQVH